jgi:hypothetical protein
MKQRMIQHRQLQRMAKVNKERKKERKKEWERERERERERGKIHVSFPFFYIFFPLLIRKSKLTHQNCHRRFIIYRANNRNNSFNIRKKKFSRNVYSHDVN